MQPISSSRSIFTRWGLFVARWKWYVAGASAIVLASLVILSVVGGAGYADTFSLPGSDSQKASDLLTQHFPTQAGSSATVVFHSDAPLTDPATQQRITDIISRIKALPEVLDVSSPYAQAGSISADGHTAFATVQYPNGTIDSAQQLVTLIERSNGSGLTVEGGGRVIQQTESAGLGSTELLGVAAAAIILVIAFGSIVAMGVPIMTALFGLGASIATLGVATNFMDMSSFTPSFAAMIGLGVGIDYCLLVLTRFREQLHSGHDVEESVALAIDTAGRSVLFAGTVVVIALVGLTLMGIPFVAALGVAAAIVVVLSVVTALTLLPALLAMLGHRVNALGIPFMKTQEGRHDESIWFRLSSAIQRRPWWFVIGSSALLLTLAIPLLRMKTGFTDAGNNATSTHSRRAYDLLTAGFGPGFNGPLSVVVETSGGQSTGGLASLAHTIGTAPGVASVSAPRTNPAGDTAVIKVYPSTSPQDSKTNDLIQRLRSDVIPGATQGTGLKAYVGGQTASTIDVSDKINSRLPIFFTMVIGLSFVVLVVVFRSLVVPLKAAVMNLLSIGAAYGALVAVFQWGWLAGPLGVHTTGPIEVFLPMMMFAILFGLSMDYEVFLVSRIREEHVNGVDNSRAVALGLSSTARVITSAALIMIAVFGSFALGDQRVIKEFGLGLAVAIFLDATVVRLLLVPAVMELLGEANWWLPNFLERLLPNAGVGSSPGRSPAYPDHAAPLDSKST
jgi:putative drug exporter of the RND superfamily